jgi:hypothetical protein
LSPGSSVTGFNPPGKVIDGAIHINDALAVQAHADAFTAYTTLAGEAQTANLSGTNLGGLILTPGVYRFDSTAQLTGTLFLDTRNDPNGTFIFQIGSSLATAPNSAVTLLGASGSDPNIFWQIGSSATIGINTIFDGNIVALTSISLAAGGRESLRTRPGEVSVRIVNDELEQRVEWRTKQLRAEIAEHKQIERELLHAQGDRGRSQPDRRNSQSS